ncbi:MAG: serine/threonine protein phosphatase [Provencibacterium sp.]|jgi:UDP-2,3-diacylglucosamine pyrophosphatase LpxH|nr:serine/threonine protein phosphatase [Provencibacterium sp.]
MYSVKTRLQETYRKSRTVFFDASSKFIIMSDCHRGQGNMNDNFMQNQQVYFGALRHYLRAGFTYIELGDGDELWENRGMEPVIEAHSDVFWLLSQFYQRGRLYLLYGNHDIVKSRRSFAVERCRHYYCEATRCCEPLFPDITITEGLVLESRETGQKIFLAHGHQGDWLNDLLWPAARFLVRYIWGPLEAIGFTAPTGAGRAREKREMVEQELAAYAQLQGRILIAGHTHRPVFSRPGKGLYFNDGSCVHPRCITGLEIENNHISLVKWAVATRDDQLLYVARELLEGPARLCDYA